MDFSELYIRFFQIRMTHLNWHLEIVTASGTRAHFESPVLKKQGHKIPESSAITLYIETKPIILSENQHSN